MPMLSKNYKAEKIRAAAMRASSHISDNPSIIDEDDYVSRDFYPGNSEFISAVEADRLGCRWRLGYASDSLIPDNFFSKKYYLAGFIFGGKRGIQNYPDGNAANEILDDMRVRTICIDDGSGRGSVAFAVVDSIGVSNADVRIIRSRLAAFARENNIISINVMSTHCHSCIDTQGLWSCPFGELMSRIRHHKDYRVSHPNGYADDEFMELLYTKTAASIVTAFSQMQTGRMYYNEADIADMISDKRPGERGLEIGSEPGVLTNLSRFTFIPDDGDARQTIIVNMNAHPCTVGLETYCENPSEKNYGECLSSGKQLSGDYVAYLDEAISDAGFNMMFFNGAIMGTYISGAEVDSQPGVAQARYKKAVAYGRKIAGIVLDMTPTDGKELAPYINIRSAELHADVDNPIIAAIGKLGIIHSRILKGDGGTYKVVTEVGFADFGGKKILLIPGELCPDLVTGKYSMTEKHSVSALAFPLPSFSEAAGISDGERLLVFGLANDATGYIIPDTDFALIRYHETLSLGRHFASHLVSAFCDICGK